MTKTKKFIAMSENPDLFQKYLDAVQRTEYLMSRICLCDDVIELYMLKTDRTGIEFVETFKEYDETNLQKINVILDKRAAQLKERWLWHYERLAVSEGDLDSWSLDLTKQDYAVLEAGTSLPSMQYYHMKWCFEDLLSTLKFIAESVNPDQEALAEIRRQKTLKN